MIRLQHHDGVSLAGQLVYREYEYSFDFKAEEQSELVRRAGASGTTSLLIGTLQIEIGIETHVALFVWGLHSHKDQWVRGCLSPVSLRPGSVKVLFDQQPIAGVSQTLVETAQVRTTYDPDSGWLCISLGNDVIADVYVEFAEDTVAGLLNEKLVELWLRPVWRRERFGEESAPLFNQLKNRP